IRRESGSLHLLRRQLAAARGVFDESPGAGKVSSRKALEFGKLFIGIPQPRILLQFKRFKVGLARALFDGCVKERYLPWPRGSRCFRGLEFGDAFKLRGDKLISG